MSDTVTRKECPLVHSYKTVWYVKLKDITPVIGTNGEEEYKILKFSAHSGTAKMQGTNQTS
jgi:hypothetical protein